MNIPVAKPYLNAKGAEYLAEAYKEGWVSSKGRFVEEFEKRFAKFIGTKFAVSASSGTAALAMALAACNIREGDEVIVPEFTMISSAWAVTILGAKPVFVDCAEDLNINYDLIEEKITPRTRAIMIVHVYGRPCDMDRINAIAKEYGLAVIEDACEAHGAEYKGRKVGSLGDAGCFSFYGNKIITSGEGGMVTTDDPDIAYRLEKFRSMWFENSHTFYHRRNAFNFRMTNLQAAVGLSQLEMIDEFLEQRQFIKIWYDKYLDSEKLYALPRPQGSVLWMYDVLAKNEHERAIYREMLSAAGVETRLFFKPMSEQPGFRGDYMSLLATSYSRIGFYLPVYYEMEEEDVKKICSLI